MCQCEIFELGVNVVIISRAFFYFSLPADARQYGQFPVRKIYICGMTWTLIDILKCMKHIKPAVSDTVDGKL